MSDTIQIPDAAAALPADPFPGAEPSAGVEPATPKTPIEVKALELGWNPDYTGEHAKTADEWVIERFDREREKAQKARAKAEKSALMAARVQAQAYDAALRDIQAQRRHAIAQGDAEAVENLDQHAERLKAEKAQIQEGPDYTNAAAWAERNQWLNPNSPEYQPDKANDAEAWFSRYLGQHPGDVDGAIEHVEAKMRQFYGPKPQPDTKPKGNPVEGRRTATGGKPAAKGFHDMPELAQKAALEFEKRTGLNRNDYAKSFFAGAQ